MVDISIENDKLIIVLSGMDKLWALKSRLEIPVGNISSVRTDPEITAKQGHTGLKITGARLGERMIAGSFSQHGDSVFWDVHNPDNAIVIELHDEKYAELILEVEDPEATVAAIQSAIG